MDDAVLKKLLPREYQERFLRDSHVRSDGRDVSSARRVSVSNGAVPTASGSAMVKLGRTTVVAGVTGVLEPPAGGDMSDATLSVAVHVLPMAVSSGYGSSGATGSAKNQDVACIATFLRENVLTAVDLSGLAVGDGALVWNLKLTVYCLDHDGNLEDAMVLASTAALLDVRLPTVRMLEDLPEGDPDALTYGSVKEGDMEDEGAPSAREDDRILAVASPECTIPLSLSEVYVSVTFAVFEGFVLVDPTRDEEAVADTTVTLVLRSNGTLRGVQKPGGAAASLAVISKCVEAANPVMSAFLGVLDTSRVLGKAT